MPLIQSSSDEAVSKNVKRSVVEGRPRKQAIAIALETQRRALRKRRRKMKSTS